MQKEQTAHTPDSQSFTPLIDELTGSPATPLKRWGLIACVTLGLMAIQFFVVPTGFDDLISARFAMLFIAVLNLAALIGQIATVGLGALYLARWIMGEPLITLIRD